MPLRRGYAEEVYIVTSGEKMSLFAARNIAKAVEQFKGRGYARLKGVILNARGVTNESEMVKRAAQEMGTEVVAEIPRDPIIQVCEEKNMTVIEGRPARLRPRCTEGWPRRSWTELSWGKASFIT